MSTARCAGDYTDAVEYRTVGPLNPDLHQPQQMTNPHNTLTNVVPIHKRCWTLPGTILGHYPPPTSTICHGTSFMWRGVTVSGGTLKTKITNADSHPKHHGWLTACRAVDHNFLYEVSHVPKLWGYVTEIQTDHSVVESLKTLEIFLGRASQT
ncbi:hypothetical protein FQN60_006218 [Etheostoma spectabile]|uniref:Uncharacterized protein n=1 Tax=Etheostoma spectabile TaxID=54343 RepID=A0A5J5CLG6_9PERO|nr:hypothetical protein FQN60_006218 [Etheostoma spectabile]